MRRHDPGQPTTRADQRWRTDGGTFLSVPSPTTTMPFYNHRCDVRMREASGRRLEVMVVREVERADRGHGIARQSYRRAADRTWREGPRPGAADQRLSPPSCRLLRTVQFAKGESDDGLDLVQPIVVEGVLVVIRHPARGEFPAVVEL